MNLIVDASIVFKWLVAENDSDLALRLRHDHNLVAPDLVLAECRNAALTNFRKGYLTEQQTRQVDQELLTLQLRILPSAPLLSDAFAIAVNIKHPIYDCVYVAAAVAAECLLITADKRFAGKLQMSATTADRVKTLDAFAREG